MGTGGGTEDRSCITRISFVGGIARALVRGRVFWAQGCHGSRG